ncbi:hypothetical protein BLNAU_3045 [Blattamonas nauphoetae]|uniref:Uncharacterized protein n=1 Tax=Blattamonas nauphoetae TaxID=2049346 RepID=A0ABQ9YE37_9EUKA|nr:hypothetical protein BLNAU_3045 [Blattamonas nauphoetae]
MFPSANKLTISEASKYSQSLVQFLRDGYIMTDTFQEYACFLLQYLQPVSPDSFSSVQVLLDLIPTPTHGPDGFLDSIFTLLQPNLPRITQLVFELLNETFSFVPLPLKLAVMENGFFGRFLLFIRPMLETFASNPLHKLMLRFVESFVVTTGALRRDDVPAEVDIGLAFELIFKTVLVPSGPYMSDVFNNRLKLSDDDTRFWMMRLAGYLLQMYPHYSRPSMLMNIHHLTLSVTSVISIYTHEQSIWAILHEIRRFFSLWDTPQFSFRWEGYMGILKLREEGIEDAISTTSYVDTDGFYGNWIRDTSQALVGAMGG